MALLEKRKRDWGRVAKVPDELGRFPEKMELLIHKIK